MDLRFRVFGIPDTEEKRLHDYLKTYNAVRYIKGYSNTNIKKIIIQVGMDKTGSTAVQHFLAENRKWLHKNSVEYASDWGGKNHSVPLMSIFSERPRGLHYHVASGSNSKQIRDYNTNKLRALCYSIRRCEQETYIFYGEGICSFTRLEYTRFRDFLIAVMPMARMEIMFCTRSNIGYASSAYQQALKLGRMHNADEIVEMYSNIHRKRMINAIDVFGKDNLTVYGFEDTLKHPRGPAGYFVERIGLPATGEESLQAPERNRSMSRNAMEILEYINKRCPLVKSGKRNKKRSLRDTKPIAEISGEKFILDADILKRILEKAKPDILWLKENFGIDYPTELEGSHRASPSYDEEYLKDCIKAFGMISDFLRELFHDFILCRIRDSQSKDHVDIFHRISKAMLLMKKCGLNSSNMQFSRSSRATSTKSNGKDLLDYMKNYANPGIKKVVIQMGMDKTATTSIQHFLASNQELLHRYSYEYYDDWGSENHSIPMKSIVHKEPESIYWHIVSGHDTGDIAEYNFNNITSLCRGVKLSNQETYIFFGEGICGFHIHELRNLRRIIKALMPNACIEVLHCVRSLEGYASSGYQQAVRMGYRFSRIKFLLVYSNIYFRRMARAMMVFGRKKMRVYKFEDTLLHKYGPVGYFCKMIGIPECELADLGIQRSNETISHGAVEIMEFINDRMPMVTDGRRNKKRTRDDINEVAGIKGERFVLPEKILKWLVGLSWIDIFWLLITFGIKYPWFHQGTKQRPPVYDKDYSKTYLEAFKKSNSHIKDLLMEFASRKIYETEGGVSNGVFMELFKSMELFSGSAEKEEHGAQDMF